VRVVKLLLNCDLVDVNARTQQQKTVCHLACERGYGDVVRALLSCDRIDWNAKDYSGTTAFVEACLKRQMSIVELLLDHQDKVDIMITSNRRIAVDESGVEEEVFSSKGCHSVDEWLSFFTEGTRQLVSKALEDHERKLLESAPATREIDSKHVRIDFEKYLGGGSFGQVYEGRYFSTTEVAVKLLRDDGSDPDKVRELFRREMKPWDKIGYHPNGDRI
jgi:hypothetical protein